MSDNQKIYRLLFILVSTFCLIPLQNAELLVIIILFQFESYLCHEKLSDMALMTMVFLVVASVETVGFIPAIVEIILIYLIVRR